MSERENKNDRIQEFGSVLFILVCISVESNTLATSSTEHRKQETLQRRKTTYKKKEGYKEDI